MIFDYLLVSKFVFYCLFSVCYHHMYTCVFSVEPVSLLLMYCVNYYYATKSLSSMWHCSATKELYVIDNFDFFPS